MPGHNPNIFMPGCVGVFSRSGSLGALMCLNLTRAGPRKSAFIGIGGDPIIGTTSCDALEASYRDDRTRAVVPFGEIGGSMEEEAAGHPCGINKPAASFIAGEMLVTRPTSPWATAGAIVTGGRAGSTASRPLARRSRRRASGSLIR